MNKQPEALRLAELIDIDNPVYQLDVNCAKAAAELRRLHEANQELLGGAGAHRKWAVAGWDR